MSNHMLRIKSMCTSHDIALTLIPPYPYWLEVNIGSVYGLVVSSM